MTSPRCDLWEITWEQFPYDRKYKELKLDHVGHLHFLGVVFLQRCSAAREEDGPNLSADQQKLTVSICSIIFSTRKWCAISLRSLAPPAVGSVSLVFHPLCSTFCSIALAVLNLDGNRHVRNWDWADCVIWVSTRCLDWYGTSLNTVRHKHFSILNERILLC